MPQPVNPCPKAKTGFRADSRLHWRHCSFYQEELLCRLGPVPARSRSAPPLQSASAPVDSWCRRSAPSGRGRARRASRRSARGWRTIPACYLCPGQCALRRRAQIPRTRASSPSTNDFPALLSDLQPEAQPNASPAAGAQPERGRCRVTLLPIPTTRDAGAHGCGCNLRCGGCVGRR